MTNQDESVNPFGAALKAASIAGGLVAGLGLATGSIAVVGVALVGTAVWFLAKNKKINSALALHGLTPEGKSFSCGTNSQTNFLTKSKTR